MTEKPNRYLVRRTDGSVRGPFTKEQLQKSAREGGITPDDELAREGSNRWVSAHKATGLFQESAAIDSPHHPAQPGQTSCPPDAPAPFRLWGWPLLGIAALVIVVVMTLAWFFAEQHRQQQEQRLLQETKVALVEASDLIDNSTPEKAIVLYEDIINRLGNHRSMSTAVQARLSTAEQGLQRARFLDLASRIQEEATVLTNDAEDLRSRRENMPDTLKGLTALDMKLKRQISALQNRLQRLDRRFVDWKAMPAFSDAEIYYDRIEGAIDLARVSISKTGAEIRDSLAEARKSVTERQRLDEEAAPRNEREQQRKENIDEKKRKQAKKDEQNRRRSNLADGPPLELLANFPDRYVGHAWKFENVEVGGVDGRFSLDDKQFNLEITSVRRNYYGGSAVYGHVAVTISSRMAELIMLDLGNDERYPNCTIYGEVEMVEMYGSKVIHIYIYKIEVFNAGGKIGTVYDE